MGVCRLTMNWLWSWAGENSLWSLKAIKSEAVNIRTETPRVFQRCRNSLSRTFRYRTAVFLKASSIQSPNEVVREESTNWEQRMGESVSASRRDSRTAAVIVTPNWKKYLPMTPCMKITGTKMARIATEDAMAGKVISLAPTMAAFTRLMPCSLYRTMFSITMMASSTTMPIASDRPSRVKVLSVKPMK